MVFRPLQAFLQVEQFRAWHHARAVFEALQLPFRAGGGQPVLFLPFLFAMVLSAALGAALPQAAQGPAHFAGPVAQVPGNMLDFQKQLPKLKMLWLSGISFKGVDSRAKVITKDEEKMNFIFCLPKYCDIRYRSRAIARLLTLRDRW